MLTVICVVMFIMLVIVSVGFFAIECYTGIYWTGNQDWGAVACLGFTAWMACALIYLAVT